MNFQFSIFNNNNRGFTLLLASLIASLLTTVGLAMFAIAQKEVQLSSLSRESQFAFYAADAGAECALYLNYFYDAFATSTGFATGDAKCDEQSVIGGGAPLNNPAQLGGGGNAQPITEFKYDLRGVDSSGAIKNYCVNVQVEKSYINGNLHTRVKSLGYNMSCSKVISSPNTGRLLERSVQMDL